MIPTMKERYRDALQTIEDLKHQISEMDDEISELEDRIEELEKEVEDADLFELDSDDLEELDAYVFLREIGFDPDNLPTSVGERIDIRNKLESKIPNLTEALDECQEQYSYLEKHYERAFELGYDPITKEFYCRACSRAGRES